MSGCEKFIHTQRQDINQEIENITKQIVDIFEEEGLLRDGWRARDYMFQGECNDMDMTCNASGIHQYLTKAILPLRIYRDKTGLDYSH